MEIHGLIIACVIWNIRFIVTIIMIIVLVKFGTNLKWSYKIITVYSVYWY